MHILLSFKNNNNAKQKRRSRRDILWPLPGSGCPSFTLSSSCSLPAIVSFLSDRLVRVQMAENENVAKEGSLLSGSDSSPSKVPYTIEDLGHDRVKATFTVPAEVVAALSTKGAVMYIRGGSFQLLKSKDSPNTVYTIFESVLPSMTCDAIAERIQFRIDNPDSPGMEMLCTIQ